MDCPKCGIANAETADRCAACFNPFEVVQQKAPSRQPNNESGGSNADPSKDHSGLNRTLTATCAAGGAVIGSQAVSHFGTALLFPAFGTVIAAYITAKKCNALFKPFILGFSLLAGQALWFSIGVLVIGLGLGIPRAICNVAELLVVLFCLAWLIRFPGIKSVTALTLYELAAGCLNVRMLTQLLPENPGHSALIIHLFFRITGLLALWYGYYSWNKLTKRTGN